MANIKHVGRLKNNKRKVFVAYRTIPGDPYSALVIFSDSVSSDEHDALVRVIESQAGQQAYELAEAMHRSYLPDGRNMLEGFHRTGQLRKVATHEVEMTPSINVSVSLDELNQIIAQQRGVALEDLPLGPKQPKKEQPVTEIVDEVTSSSMRTVDDVVTLNEEPLTDEQLAAKYRSDADRLSKEAATLRRMAEELVPTKKKTIKQSA